MSTKRIQLTLTLNITEFDLDRIRDLYGCGAAEYADIAHAESGIALLRLSPISLASYVADALVTAETNECIWQGSEIYAEISAVSINGAEWVEDK